MATRYPFKQRVLIAETIKAILITIKENEGINLFKLLAIVHVNPPYIKREKGVEFLKDLEKAGQITVDKDTREVKTIRGNST